MFLTVGLVLFAQNEKDVLGLRHRGKKTVCAAARLLILTRYDALFMCQMMTREGLIK